jgi:hypothetical protein
MLGHPMALHLVMVGAAAGCWLTLLSFATLMALRVSFLEILFFIKHMFLGEVLRDKPYKYTRNRNACCPGKGGFWGPAPKTADAAT